MGTVRSLVWCRPIQTDRNTTKLNVVSPDQKNGSDALSWSKRRQWFFGRGRRGAGIADRSLRGANGDFGLCPPSARTCDHEPDAGRTRVALDVNLRAVGCPFFGDTPYDPQNRISVDQGSRIFRRLPQQVRPSGTIGKRIVRMKG